MSENEAAVTDYLANIEEMMAGTGRHEGHERQQIGRCVHCSCGMRVQVAPGKPKTRKDRA